MNTPPPNTDDAQLLARISRGDRQAFSRLYDRYSALLYSTLSRTLNNSEAVAEAFQDLFAQIWDQAGSYDPASGKPFHWVLTLARNTAVDRLRALRRRYGFIEEIALELDEGTRSHVTVPGEVFNPEQVTVIRAAVASLPLEQRQAIEMAFLGGLTQHEIAAALNQPVGTVKARIRRGMLTLQERLRPIV